jgi:hypothetical protein
MREQGGAPVKREQGGAPVKREQGGAPVKREQGGAPVLTSTKTWIFYMFWFFHRLELRV